MNSKLFDLYKASPMYALWPVEQSKFEAIIYGTQDLNNETNVIIDGPEDNPNGFISIKVKKVGTEVKGSVVFIIVRDTEQRKGIGKNLIENAIDWLKEKKVEKITIGGSAGSYFWPGIPENLIVNEFFEKCGFQVKIEGAVDMYRDVTNFVTPGGVFERMEEQGIQIAFANSKWSEKIVDFVERNFPHWGDYYKRDVADKNYKKIFFARYQDEIVGVSQLWRDDCLWKSLFENSVGGGGALGVAENWRGKGIGLALKSWGTEKINDSKRKYVYVSWTYATEFYEKLGFQVWRRYADAKLLD